MSDRGEGPRQPRRLHRDYVNDPNFSHHPEYRERTSRQSSSKSSSKSASVSPPGYFDEQYDATMAGRATQSSPAYRSASSAHDSSPKSKDKTTAPKDQRTSSSPTEPQTSHALTVTNPQDGPGPKWSSTVRPPPYDPARMPGHREAYIDEELYIIAWGVWDGIRRNDLGILLPHRPQGPAVGQYWARNMQGKKEFAWATERGLKLGQDEDTKKKEEKKQRAEDRLKVAKEKDEAKEYRAEKKRRSERRIQEKEEEKQHARKEVEDRKRKKEAREEAYREERKVLKTESKRKKEAREEEYREKRKR